MTRCPVSLSVVDTPWYQSKSLQGPATMPLAMSAAASSVSDVSDVSGKELVEHEESEDVLSDDGVSSSSLAVSAQVLRIKDTLVIAWALVHIDDIPSRNRDGPDASAGLDMWHLSSFSWDGMRLLG